MAYVELPTVNIESRKSDGFPVLQLLDETSGEIEYALRLESETFQAPAFGAGPYTIRVGEPGVGEWATWEGLVPAATREAQERVLRW